MSSGMQANKFKQDIIEIVTNDIYIEIKIQQTWTHILILKIDQFQKVRKYFTETNLIGQNSHFGSLSDFGQFMLSPENYRWQDEILNLKLLWKIEAVKYYRDKQLDISLKEINLSEREVIEAENKILKKQLEYYKERTLITKRENKQKDKKQEKLKQEKQKGTEDEEQVLKGSSKIRNNKKQRNKVREESHQKQEKVGNSENQSSSSFDQRQEEVVEEQREEFEEQIGTDSKKQRGRRQKKDQLIPIMVKDRIQYIKTRLRTTKTLTKKGKKKKIAKSPKDVPKGKKNPSLLQKTKQIQKIDPAKKGKGKKQKKQKLLKQEILSQKSFSSNSQSAGFRQQRSKKYLGQNIFLIKYANGEVYRGELKNNKFHGKGVYFGKKLKFEGQWREGQTYGAGVSYYNDGGVQKGIYRPGFKRFGVGEDKYSNGQSYVGNFHNQKKNGQGTYYFQNGEYYEGQWMDDMQHGNGTEFFKDGSRFEGMWEADEKNGQGTLITKLGKIKQVYSRGILTREYVLLDE